MSIFSIDIVQVEARHGAAVEEAIAGLRYGSVCVNVATMMGFCMTRLSWGGFAGNTPEAPFLLCFCVLPPGPQVMFSTPVVPLKHTFQRLPGSTQLRNVVVLRCRHHEPSACRQWPWQACCLCRTASRDAVHRRHTQDWRLPLFS